jgi:hypothetical protein
MSSGLVRHLASSHDDVLVVLRYEDMPTARRLFGDLRIRYWFESQDTCTHSRASALGYTVMHFPTDVIGAYADHGLTSIDMHKLFVAQRSTDREAQVLQHAKEASGDTFVLTHGPISPHALPRGITVLDADTLALTEPMDLCGVIMHAVQIHAVDGWVLTLADLIGATSQKYCHAYASVCGAGQCRKKYRKRIVLLVHPAA